MSDYNEEPQTVICPHCGGAGEVPAGDDDTTKPCPLCDGNKEISANEERAYHEENHHDDWHDNTES